MCSQLKCKGRSGKHVIDENVREIDGANDFWLLIGLWMETYLWMDEHSPEDLTTPFQKCSSFLRGNIVFSQIRQNSFFPLKCSIG